MEAKARGNTVLRELRGRVRQVCVRVVKLPTRLKHLSKRRSCSKHGPYDGPYCPKCYQRVIGEMDEKEVPAKTN